MLELINFGSFLMSPIAANGNPQLAIGPQKCYKLVIFFIISLTVVIKYFFHPPSPDEAAETAEEEGEEGLTFVDNFEINLVINIFYKPGFFDGSLKRMFKKVRNRKEI